MFENLRLKLSYLHLQGVVSLQNYVPLNQKFVGFDFELTLFFTLLFPTLIGGYTTPLQTSIASLLRAEIRALSASASSRLSNLVGTRCIAG